MIAQLGWPDMRLPILYSMSWPHRLKVRMLRAYLPHWPHLLKADTAVAWTRGMDEKSDQVKLGSSLTKSSSAPV